MDGDEEKRREREINRKSYDLKLNENDIELWKIELKRFQYTPR